MAKATLSLREQFRALSEKRAVQMARLRDGGWSYAMIGRKYGLTRQRAFQIVSAYDAEQKVRQETAAAA